MKAQVAPDLYYFYKYTVVRLGKYMEIYIEPN